MVIHLIILVFMSYICLSSHIRIGVILTNVPTLDLNLKIAINYAKSKIDSSITTEIVYSTFSKPLDSLAELSNENVKHFVAFCLPLVVNSETYDYVVSNNMSAWCLDSRAEQCSKNFFFWVDGSDVFFSSKFNIKTGLLHLWLKSYTKYYLISEMPGYDELYRELFELLCIPPSCSFTVIDSDSISNICSMEETSTKSVIFLLLSPTRTYEFLNNCKNTLTVSAVDRNILIYHTFEHQETFYSDLILQLEQKKFFVFYFTYVVHEKLPQEYQTEIKNDLGIDEITELFFASYHLSYFLLEGLASGIDDSLGYYISKNIQDLPLEGVKMDNSFHMSPDFYLVRFNPVSVTEIKPIKHTYSFYRIPGIPKYTCDWVISVDSGIVEGLNHNIIILFNPQLYPLQSDTNILRDFQYISITFTRLINVELYKGHRIFFTLLSDESTGNANTIEKALIETNLLALFIFTSATYRNQIIDRKQAFKIEFSSRPLIIVDLTINPDETCISNVFHTSFVATSITRPLNNTLHYLNNIYGINNIYIITDYAPQNIHSATIVKDYFEKLGTNVTIESFQDNDIKDLQKKLTILNYTFVVVFFENKLHSNIFSYLPVSTNSNGKLLRAYFFYTMTYEEKRNYADKLHLFFYPETLWYDIGNEFFIKMNEDIKSVVGETTFNINSMGNTLYESLLLLKHAILSSESITYNVLRLHLYESQVISSSGKLYFNSNGFLSRRINIKTFSNSYLQITPNFYQFYTPPVYSYADENLECSWARIPPSKLEIDSIDESESENSEYYVSLIKIASLYSYHEKEEKEYFESFLLFIDFINYRKILDYSRFIVVENYHKDTKGEIEQFIDNMINNGVFLFVGGKEYNYF